MVQTEEERKAKIREYNQRPEVKARKKAWAQKYRNTSEVKAKRKEYDSRPENKLRRKKYTSKPEVRAKIQERNKKYSARPDVKAKKKEYDSRPESKAKMKGYRKKYRENPENLAKIRKYTREYREQNRPKIRKYNNELRQRLKIEIFSEYSKRHSNSDVPCCRCCGENSHIDFLSVDHVEGRKNFPKEQQKLRGVNMYEWIKRNDYPDNFQILCHNCNLAKGFFGACPHERMRKEETFAMMEEQSSFEAGF